MLSIKSAVSVQHHLVLLSPQNLTVESRTGGHVLVGGGARYRRRTRRAVGESRNGCVRNAGVSVELAVRPAEGDALLTGPHVGGEVRVGGLHIRPRGSLGELHLGGTRLHVEGSCELTAGGLLKLVLVGLRGRLRLRLGLGSRLRCRVRLLIVVLSLRQVCILVAVSAVQIQVLPCEQGAATLGRLAHDRRE